MSTKRIAINGFGRIGRHFLKVAWGRDDMEIVAINDLTDTKTLAHLLKYDTAYPDFAPEVKAEEGKIIIGGKEVKAFSERDPLQLPWKDLGVDIVIESTGVFRTREKASMHIEAGAKKVVLSAPGKGDGIDCRVRGLNCESYDGADVVDNASCTTNCTAPVMKVLEEQFGVEKSLLTTIHAYTADQNLQDGPHKDLRRARAAAQNMVPTSTGAAVATARVIPSLEGKFDGLAIRVPTITVSLIDISVVLKKDVTAEEINQKMKEASETYLKDILAVTDEPLVSSDFIGNPYSSIVDLGLTKVVGGNLAKIISWYDNEWGYANRLVEMAGIVGKSL